MQQPNTLLLKRLGLLLVLLMLLVAGYQIYLGVHFRIVSTSPKICDMYIYSPFLKVNFNRQLTAKSLSVSSKPTIIKSYSVSGKVLTINLNYPLNSSGSYAITLNSVSDTKGKTIGAKTFTFKPKYVPYSALSTDQQKTMLQNQTQKQPSKNNIGFSGLDSLTGYGVTSAQVGDLQQAIFKFLPTTQSAALDTSSIDPAGHDPTSANRYDSISFNIAIDSKNYKATINYSGLTTLQLILFDVSSGAQVFDSGNLTSQ
jgi:hypothetical protein